MRSLSPFGLPCKQPAWGYVAGVDLNTHEVAWKRRIGTIRDSLPGIQLPPFKMGCAYAWWFNLNCG